MDDEGQGWPGIQRDPEVFWLYKEVADPVDVVIQKQRFANADRRAPVTAMLQCP
jgi:hypothetical protein